ncbi:Gfo/Idh/MocA family oxidoreductase [Streptomyces sp. NPDC004237]|uniref:Gfo/Idh/MocA family protein n=1 Tax=Streptomyces sp. NPDC004237 TaxID=3154455 RepID=UPI0033AA1B40
MTDRSTAPESVPELRIGVVGFGQRASLAALADRPGTSRVVSCADPAERGRTDARAVLGPDVRVHDRYEDLLEDGLDAVFVLTPDDVHTAPALFFLEAGVAVFVEKPLAVDLDDCDRVLAAAARTRTRLYVGHNLRHLPVLRAMRRLIDEGTIGGVRAVWCRHFVGHGGDYYFKDWHAERARTTGLLLQKGAHDLDAIHWLAGGSARTVTALGDLAVYGASAHRRTRPQGPERVQDWFDEGIWPPSALRDLNPVIDVEDISMVLTRLDNGVLTSYQQCHFTPDYWRNYTVIGDEGRIENLGDGIQGAAPLVKVWNRRRSGYRPEADLTLDPAEPTDGLHGGADQALVDEFLRFVAYGGATATSPVAAREAVATGIAATTSLRAGGAPVEVPALAPPLADYFAHHQPGSRAPSARTARAPHHP